MEPVRIDVTKPRQTTFEITIQEVYYDERTEKRIQVINTALVLSGLQHTLDQMWEKTSNTTDDGRNVAPPEYFHFRDMLLDMSKELLGEKPKCR